MNISEAVKKALKINGVIYRAGPDQMWEGDEYHMRAEPNNDTIYLQTIARPDLCPTHMRTPYFRDGGWNPSAADILADDWEVETMEQFKSYASPEYLELINGFSSES